MSEPIRPEPTPGLTPLVSMFPLHLNDDAAPRPARQARPLPEQAAPAPLSAPVPASQPGRQAAG